MLIYGSSTPLFLPTIVLMSLLPPLANVWIIEMMKICLQKVFNSVETMSFHKNLQNHYRLLLTVTLSCFGGHSVYFVVW